MSKIIINTIVKEGIPDISQEEFVKELAQRSPNIEGIELRREYFSTDSQKRENEFLSILETGKLKGWKIMYSVPESLFIETGLNPAFKNWLEEAKQLNVESMKVNIGNLDGIAKVSNSEWMDYLKDSTVKVTIENDQTQENGYLSSVLKGLYLISEQQLPIGYTFDLGNWLVMDEEPLEAFQKTQEFISVLHLKNMNESAQPVLLDQGILNWREYIKKDWPIVLEYPMNFEEITEEIKLVLEEV